MSVIRLLLYYCACLRWLVPANDLLMNDLGFWAAVMLLGWSLASSGPCFSLLSACPFLQVRLSLSLLAAVFHTPLILTLTFVVSALCSRNRCFAHRHRFLDRGTSFFFVRMWVLTNWKTQTTQFSKQLKLVSVYPTIHVCRLIFPFPFLPSIRSPQFRCSSPSVSLRRSYSSL